MFDVDYPPSFRRFLDGLSISNLNFLNIFSVGCAWQSNFYDSLRVFTLGPLILIIALTLCLHLRMALARRMNQSSPSYSLQQSREQSKLVIIFVAFVFFSPSSVHIFQTFVCEEFKIGLVHLFLSHV
jgi:hypothetical protein